MAASSVQVRAPDRGKSIATYVVMIAVFAFGAGGVLLALRRGAKP